MSLIISFTTLLKVNFVQLNQAPYLKLPFSEESLSISPYYQRRVAIWNRIACFWRFGHLFYITNIINLHLIFTVSVFTLISHVWCYTWCPCGSDWFHLFLVMINCFTDCQGRSYQGRILDSKNRSFLGTHSFRKSFLEAKLHITTSLLSYAPASGVLIPNCVP